MYDKVIQDCYVFLHPVTINNGVLKALKKNRIIRDITGSCLYDNTTIPIAKVNMGILRKYDYKGVMKYVSRGEI